MFKFRFVRYRKPSAQRCRRHGRMNRKNHPHRVLYTLREALGSLVVFSVAGEKDVETLRFHVFVATTNAVVQERGGCSSPVN